MTADPGTSPRPWWRALLALGLAVGLVAVGLHQVTQRDPRASVSDDRDSRQLAFSLPLFTGGQLSTEDLRGTPVVLSFYASWCQLCRQEMPDLQRIAEDAGARVAVIGVKPQSNDDDASQARLVAATGVRYRTVRDRQDALLRVFNPSGALPTTVFLSADGKVLRVVNGLLNEGKIARILAADVGITLRTQTPDRTTRRPEPTPASPTTGRP